MKKNIATITAIFVFAVCCMFSFNAFASEDVQSIELTNDNSVVTLDQSSYIYTGSAITPAVIVNYVNDNVTTTLTQNTDYKVSYSNNTNVGTATLKIDGIGNYSGSISKTFTIDKLSIASSSISISNEKLVVGSSLNVTVKLGKKTLVKGTDYKVSVENNEKVGIKSAKVTITGIGNFKGKKSYKLHVYPKRVTSVSLKSRNASSITLQWTSQSSYGVTGYRVYTCDKNGNNSKYYGYTTSNSMTINKRSASTFYYFKVRAYKASGDDKIFGEYSSVYSACTTPAKVTLNYVTSASNKKSITANWNKISSDGYQIQYSTDKKFKNSVKYIDVKNSKTTSYKISVKASKTYYVRVRAYKKSGNSHVYGAWSVSLSNNYSKLYATYTTNYVNNADRTTNLKLACEAINGTIVQPGETFSFNKVVGKRTASKGYKNAHIFTGANSSQMGLGGGICQVASTMFNTTLLANFDIVERYQHSQRVTYVPLGRDAAIYWGSEDFKFKNTTNYPIKIVMSCKNGKITCSFYTCQNISPKKVSLKVTQKGKNFTLKRYVDGKVNYTTKSKY